MKTVAEYEARGRLHAELGVDTVYERSAFSWQARAYWRGYDAEKARLEAHKEKDPGPAPKPRHQMNVQVLRELSKGYPGAAQAHFLTLAESYNREQDEKRARRLHSAVVRLFHRHSGGPGRAAALEQEIRGA